MLTIHSQLKKSIIQDCGIILKALNNIKKEFINPDVIMNLITNVSAELESRDQDKDKKKKDKFKIFQELSNIRDKLETKLEHFTKKNDDSCVEHLNKLKESLYPIINNYGQYILSLKKQPASGIDHTLDVNPAADNCSEQQLTQLINSVSPIVDSSPSKSEFRTTPSVATKITPVQNHSFDEFP